jgi:hypothetical protein
MFTLEKQQRMSVVRKALAAAATLLAVGGVSTFGAGAANAATLQCGPSCIDIFNAAYGTYASPNFVETVRNGFEKVGQPTELYSASSWNPAEDLMPIGNTVTGFFAAGMVSAAVNSQYGSLKAAQIDYAPLGVPTGLCAAVATTPYQDQGLTLQPCTVPGRTVWIIDPMVSQKAGYFALINGANTDFSRPFAMTMNADPTCYPVQIQVDHLRSSDDQGAATLPLTQLWGADMGVPPVSSASASPASGRTGWCHHPSGHRWGHDSD